MNRSRAVGVLYWQHIYFGRNIPLMKRLFWSAVFICLATSLATNAFAQTQKSKDEYLREISTLSNTKKPEDMDRAYQLSKEFFIKFPNEDTVNAKKLKDFIKRYKENSFYKSLEDKKYADAFATGKEIMAEQPNNVEVAMNLGYGGYDVILKTNAKTYAEESLKYCKLTLQLLEKGIVPTNFSPFKNKDEATAWMYYVIGYFSTDKDLREAAMNFYKSTQYESQVKHTSQPYYVIAIFFEKVYEKAANDLNEKVKAKTISDADFKTTNEKIDTLLDRMMDAYARAIARGELEKTPAVADWNKRLLEVYQFRKKSDAGFYNFVARVNNSQMPDPSGF
jgi:hypothetical protein